MAASSLCSRTRRRSSGVWGTQCRSGVGWRPILWLLWKGIGFEISIILGAGLVGLERMLPMFGGVGWGVDGMSGCTEEWQYSLLMLWIDDTEERLNECGAEDLYARFRKSCLQLVV